MTYSLTFEATISLVLSFLYAAHAYIVFSHDTDLKTNEAVKEKIGSLPAGTGWIFLLVTVGLPLVCSICANFHLAPVQIPAEKSLWHVMPAFMYGLALTIFVLMITIEIGYLYDARFSSWKNYIIGALVLDLMSVLVFVAVLTKPVNVAEEQHIDSLFYILVSIGSLVSSCGTILISKIHSMVEGTNETRSDLQPA